MILQIFKRLPYPFLFILLMAVIAFLTIKIDLLLNMNNLLKKSVTENFQQFFICSYFYFICIAQTEKIV